jgi:orotate phosphoribosyltransferase
VDSDQLPGSDLLHDLHVRTGHFRYESGHHGDLWLELDALFTDPARTERLAAAMTDRLGGRGIEVVCGPMTGGALLAQAVARQLGVTFTYTDRVVESDNSVSYVLPRAQESLVRGRRLAIVDDAINAGSATGGTHQALVAAGARPVAIGALLIEGHAIDRFAQVHGLHVLACSRRESNLWTPESCPLCARGIPLEPTS